MSKALRAALFVLASKEGRSVLLKIIAAIMCLFTFLMVILQGFATSYIAVLGGTHNDAYSQAVDMVKEELQISNDLEPSYLRAIYYKQNRDSEPDVNEVVNIIKSHFVFSQPKQRTITEDDIKKLQKRIDELNKKLEAEEKAAAPDPARIEELKQKIDEVEKKLKKAEKTYSDETGDEYFFYSSTELNAILTSAPFNLSDDDLTEVTNYLLLMNSSSSSDDFDFSDVVFFDEDLNNIQKRIVDIALASGDYGIIPGYNQCEKWVEDVYQEAGCSRSGSHCAICAGRAFSVSKDWSKIQVGATVYGTASQQYGHVGIYIGSGLVIHNLSGNVKVQSLESWVKDFNGKCWGWDNRHNLSGNPLYNCVGGLI